jgi:hypothetical protein
MSLQNLISQFKKWKITEEKEIIEIEKILKAISTPQNNEEEEEKEKEKNGKKFNIKYVNNYKYMFDKDPDTKKGWGKKKNDSIANYREAMYCEMYNDSNFRKIFEGTKYENNFDKRLKNLKEFFHKNFNKIIPNFDKFRLEKKAGRNNHYDYDGFPLDKSGKKITLENSEEQFKRLELKCNTKDINATPQILNKNISTCRLFDLLYYDAFYYDNLPRLFDKLPQNEKEKCCKKHKETSKGKYCSYMCRSKLPKDLSISIYLKELKNDKHCSKIITNHSWKMIHEFFENIKNIIDARANFFKKYTDNKDIENELNKFCGNIINIEVAKEIFYNSQKDKHIIFEKDGKFSYLKLTDEIITIKKFSHFKKGKNENYHTLVFEHKEPGWRSEWLLRWKNGNGIINIAYQIALRNNLDNLKNHK